MRIGETVISAVMLLIGAYVALTGMSMPLTSAVGPGPGFMPVVSGTVLAGLSLTSLVLLLLGQRALATANAASLDRATGPISTAAISTAEVQASQESPAPDSEPVTVSGAIRVAIVIAAQIGFIILFQLLGFAIAIFAFLLCIIKIVGRSRWHTALIAAFLMSAAFYVGFKILLGVPFPAFLGVL